MNRFDQLCAESASANESSDCAVKAVASALNVKYQYALGALAATGREPNSATPTGLTDYALSALGWKMIQIPLSDLSGKVVRTVSRNLPRGTYLLRTKNHILCVKNGKIIDSPGLSSKRVTGVYRVEQWRCAVCGTRFSVEERYLPPDSFSELPSSMRRVLLQYSFNSGLDYYAKEECKAKRFCTLCYRIAQKELCE